MKRSAVFAVILCTVMLVPTAAADHVSNVEEIEGQYIVTKVHADDADTGRLIFDATCELIYPFCQEPHYRSEAVVEIWEETNGCDGLQERQIDCDGDGRFNEADTQVQAIGCASGGTDPCGQTAQL